ncbi:MFS transporter [Hirschia baltica]|uniref:Major facilitator superfamily MFS_1 n=1 Tax=Hirschia baltica (strain ATCC 49814 / DSM 5838 / IFAM 1418) TaxID=582402 RepID=C6XJB3_HIRBI|nr:MFS transporter [Hirschia baltica]ACT59208.1 major facilitator superfamily MFS_1 [Hirschia baltica ATCC 49814]
MSQSDDHISETAPPPKLRAGASDISWPNRRYAWYVVALLTLAYALAILDRVSIALLIEPLEASLHITDTQFGLLQGLAFSLFYSVLGLPIGLLCDRTKRTPILTAALALWSLATMGCSLATTFEELFFARILVGVGEAALVPAAASLIADLFPPSTRPKAYGVFVTGSSLGTAAAFLFSGLFLHLSHGLINDIPHLASNFQSWQLVFIMCGMPGVALSLIMLLTMREPKRQGVETTKTEFSFKPIFKLFSKQPVAFATLIGGTVLNLVCVYAIIGWLPAMFIRVHNWEASTAGQILGLVGLPISLFAAANSGWVISWLNSKGRTDAPMLAAAACGISMLIFGTATSLAPTGLLAIIAYALNALFVNWNISAVYSGVSQISPNQLRGQVMALHTIASSLIAMTAGNFFVGFLTDTFFTSPEGISYALAIVFFTCGTGSAILLTLGRHAFAKAVAANEEKVTSND